MNPRVAIPKTLKEKLEDSTEVHAVGHFNAKVSEVLNDNKTVFFPNYTDHGVKHIDRLLEVMATYLIPQEALRNLNSADVAVLVCASLLHDLAMHLTEFGFQALINGQSHSPLPWFNLDSHGRVGDLSWIEEWDNYRSEVKRFCDHDFFLVLGDLPPPSQVIHWLETELPDNPIEWTGADKLLIGEFVRRKHGRLAHEIAMFGFPGLSAADFPILDEILPKLADIIGTVARSHSLPIREAAQYFEETYPKDRRPRGVAALYHMALLRVADYLQIEF